MFLFEEKVTGIQGPRPLFWITPGLKCIAAAELRYIALEECDLNECLCRDFELLFNILNLNCEWKLERTNYTRRDITSYHFSKHVFKRGINLILKISQFMECHR